MTDHLPETFDVAGIGAWCGAQPAEIAAVHTSEAPRLVVSGRLASGKDTVAAAVMEALGRTDSVQISFATALREEIKVMLDIVKAAADLDAAIDSVATWAGVHREEAVATTTALWDALASNPAITPYTRTKEMRTALQTWGTDVRRKTDDAYWVKQGARAAFTALAAGHPVHITDARFVNEVEIAQGMGFWAVRLEVDLDVRARRLWDRDQLEIDPAAETHPSEEQLENFLGFDHRVSNNGPLEKTVADILAAMPTRPQTWLELR